MSARHRHQSVGYLRRLAAASRVLADQAARMGWWDEAADHEERAILAEHHAAVLAAELAEQRAQTNGRDGC